MLNPTALPFIPAGVNDIATRFSHLDVSDHVARVAQGAALTEPRDRSIRLQSASRLLSLPTELRLMICRYLSLSPEYGFNSIGAYHSCRQLQKDMWDELRPSHDLENYIQEHKRPCSHRQYPYFHVLPSLPRFQLLRNLTITALIPHISRRRVCCYESLAALFPLYLNRLWIRLVPRNDRYEDLPEGDMKSWPDRYFLTYVVQGKVNCKNVSFCLTALADEEDGRCKTTRIANIIPGTKILYVMYIVEDKIGRQTERTYSSDVRFRPMALKDRGAQRQ